MDGEKKHRITAEEGKMVSRNGAAGVLTLWVPNGVRRPWSFDCRLENQTSAPQREAQNMSKKPRSLITVVYLIFNRLL